MNERQRRFVDAYLRNANAAQAAREAGYSTRSAKQIGEKLLTKYDFYIKTRLKEMENRRVAATQEKLEYLTKVMRGEYKEEVMSSNGTVRRLEISHSHRIKACELLLKVEGMFKEKPASDGVKLFREAVERVWQDDTTSESIQGTPA